MRHDRLPAYADMLRDLADIIDTDGPERLQRAQDWARGPQPGDNHHTPPQPGDQDYQGADDPLDALSDDRRADMAGDRRAAAIHPKLTRELDAHHAAAARILELLGTLQAVHPPRSRNPELVDNDGWCRSCTRNAGHLEPVAIQSNGTPRYVNMCRFCGEWSAAHDGCPPPLPILRAKHTGRRITTTLVERVGR